MLLATTCPVCQTPGPAPCGRCAAALRPSPALPEPAGVDRCVALLAYEGAGRELVARLKYRNNRAALAGLARAMAALVDPADHDLVTWLPTTADRRRERGFDQAELLAKAVARALRLRCRPMLRRASGSPQTGRDRAARQQGPHFTARRRVPTDSRLLVVDDVVTSGATATAAARALRASGAARVTVLAAARTPLKPRSVVSDTSRNASQ